MRFQDLSRKWRWTIIILMVIILFLALFDVSFTLFLHDYRQTCARERKAFVKSAEARIGKRMMIDRKDKKAVVVNVYLPKRKTTKRLPLIINIHGGGFVAGNADALDTQSARLSHKYQAVIVSVNYTTADVQPISYGVREIVDTIHYFVHYAKKYFINSHKVFLMGYSAGAYYATQATMQLSLEHFTLEGLILCYPWTRGLPTYRYNHYWPPTMFVLAGKDPISQNAKSYIRQMKHSHIKTQVLDVSNAQHSFIESNNPEGEKEISRATKGVINKEQKRLARQAERKIGRWIDEI